MRKIKTERLSIIGWILTLVSFTFTGCIKEKFKDCPNPVAVSVQVVSVEGEDITDQNIIDTLSFYVFDNKKTFIKFQAIKMGESLKLYFPDQDTIYLVSWGNLDKNNLYLPTLQVGIPMHEAVIRLLENPSPAPKGKANSARSVAMSPSDLFYSYDEIALKSGNKISYTLQMNRTVGSMAIIMKNLQSYANRYDENYSLVVRETFNTIDFYGRLTGDKVSYVPDIKFNDKKELLAPIFNLFPSHAEGVIEIDIYNNNELVTTLKNDNEGHPLKVLTGTVLNVIVDFRMQVSVEVSITPWGITEIEKEY